MHRTTCPLPDTARWIASPMVGAAAAGSPAPYFRKAFVIASRPTRAVLHITALGVFEAEINGARVGDEVFAPGWTEYRKRITCRSYDVTTMLREGENALGAIVGDGWAVGHIADKNRQHYSDRPKLLALLEIACADGDTVTVRTDGTWLTAAGAVVASDMLQGESHDARLDPGPWSEPGFSADGWVPALECEAPDAEISPQIGPSVRRQEILAATLASGLERPEWQSPLRVFDLGQNITGRVRLRVSGRRGTTLKIRHAEVLNANGTLYTSNLRTARATDYYTLRGGGLEEWEPRFTFHGFRYFEISWQGRREDIGELSAEGVVLHSHMARTGEFSCSNPLLNQLAHNILWGQKGNFLDIPTDCPQRDERLGWTGDAQAFIRTAAFFMDIREFFQKWLLTMRDSQGPDGAIPPTVPHTGSFGLPQDGGPAWADAAFICPWVLYRHYGDEQILRDHYECMVRYMEYLKANKVQDGIRCHPAKDGWGGFGDWLALDGSGRIEGGTPKDLIGTAFYAHNAAILADAAEVIGRPEDAASWRALRDVIVAAFRRRFVTPEGLMASGTQTAYVLALHFGLLDEAQRATAFAELIRDIERRGYHIATGFVGTPYILHVLEAGGRTDVAYKLLEQETFPSWLFPVKNGATTIWERWDGWTPEMGFQDPGMNSFNHYAYGAVGDWMVSTVAGIEPAEPGFRRILFKPRPGGSITSASASLVTPHGKSAIAWSLDRGTLSVSVEVPANTVAVFSAPPRFAPHRDQLGPGRHRFELASV